MSTQAAQNIEDIYPLSPLQQGMLFHTLLDSESGVYLMQDRYRIGGRIDEEAFLRAWQLVVAAHPALRTSFLWKTQKQPLQIVHKHVDVPVTLIDLRDRAAEEQESHIRSLLQTEQTQGFHMNQPPLIRFRLVRLGEESYELIRSFHHIVMDAWCISLIMVDFVQAYDTLVRGEAPQFRRTRPYRDYINWLQKQERARAQAFWQAQLAGLDTPTSLPIDSGRRQARYLSSVVVDDLTVHLSSQQSDAIRQFCQEHHFTPNTFFQGAWSLLLARYSGQRDVLFGVTVAGRPPGLAGVEDMIGLFINTLPLRVAVGDDDMLLPWLRRLQGQNVELREFESTPLVNIQGWSAFPREESLFDSILVYENAPIDDKLLRGDLSFRLEGMEHSVHTHYGLTVVILPSDRLGIRISYDRQRFARDAIERMLGHLVELMLDMAARPAAQLGALRMLTAAEQQALLQTWNQTHEAFPLQATYAELFARQADAHPERIAAVCAGETLRYGELAQRARRLAQALVAAGAPRDTVVVLLAERGLALLTMMIAVQEAGAAMLPLDVNHPPERLAELVTLSRPPVVLMSESARALWQQISAALPEPPPCLLAEALWQPGDDAEDDAFRPTPGRPEDLAYVIFTSGSTGTPKGVMVEQRGMLNNIYGKVPSLGLSAADRIAQTASPAFDISVWQFLAAPLLGGTVHILPDPVAHDPARLLAAVEEHAITLLEAVPAVLRSMLEVCPDQVTLPALRWVLPTGEALPPALCRLWFARFPHVPLMNAYGPAECSDDVAFHPITASPPADCVHMPIGRPTANNQLLVLDESLRPVPIGVPGELCVAGVGVGRGYLFDPERTRAAFVPHPFVPGARLYRTGDLGRWRPDGILEFLGRKDQQVKVRGHRIELGEIESRLERHTAVDTTAVLALPDARGDLRLVAYWQPVPGATADAAALAAHLGRTLPPYMVPAIFIALDALPLNPNGKLDRKALATRPLHYADALTPRLVPPRNDTEAQLAVLWAELLALPHVSVHDSFFALGGHSLLATQVISRIRARFHVELPLRALFEHPTLAQLAHAVDLARAQQQQLPQLPPITPQPRADKLPLSFAQQRLWFLEQLQGQRQLFTIPFALRLTGSLQPAALHQSFEALIARHEVLRTAFLADHGQPWQTILPPAPFPLPIVDLSVLDQHTRHPRLAHELDAFFALPFDLERPPLLRATLFRIDSSEHILAIALHHIVSDAWSATLAIRELTQCYRTFALGEPLALDALPIQYADFAIWQRQHVQGQEAERQLAYWKKVLDSRDGETPSYVLQLPTDRPRPAAQSYRAGSVLQWLSPELSARLHDFAGTHRLSAFTVVFAGFAALLHRLTGQAALFIGTPVSNRQRAETEGLLGILLNNLVIRTDFAERPSFTALARCIADALFEAQQHQDLPFEQLVDALALPRSLSHAPLFQVMVAQQLPMEARIQFPGLTIEQTATPLAHSEYDLDLHVTCPHDGPVELELLYALDLFEHDTVIQWLSRFEYLLGELLSEPNRAVIALDVLTPAERHQQLVTWNDTAKAYPGPHTLAHALEAQRLCTPDAPALSYENITLSYAALHNRADRLAHALRSRGIGRETIIGVCMERSVELVVALLGVVKAGAAYLPLDPELPPARLAFLLADAQAPLVLTQPHLHGQLSVALPDTIPVLSLDAAAVPDWLAAQPAHAPVLDNEPADLAYVIYTSGSTGQPKGVLNEHGALMNRLWWMQDAFPIDAADRVLQKTPYSFDVSVWEFFWPLITGAHLVLARPDGHRDSGYLVALIQQFHITTLHFVPSMLQAFLHEPGLPACSSLRQVFSSGEALPWELQQRFCARHPAALINLYGPTEAAIDVSVWPCDPASPLARVPIGTPIANLELYILDDLRQLLPPGAGGELYIGGAGLARGYLDRPALTAERFVPHPFRPGRRLYRTGDRCRFLQDGNIEYLGRLDHQVKLRGLRIELGEIEAHLLAHPAVLQAAVLVRDDLASPQLVAYVVPRPGHALADDALRAHLARELPPYMVPALFLPLETLPLSANGKLDRKALPRPTWQGEEAREPLVGQAEQVLAGLWSEVLGVPLAQLGRQSNFFALGGHSLLATVLLARMRETFPRPPSLRALFEQPTLAALAAGAGEPGPGAAPTIVPGPRPARLPLSPAQQRLWFLSQLAPESAEYNIAAAVEAARARSSPHGCGPH